jgi:hypothetical protein
LGASFPVIKNGINVMDLQDPIWATLNGGYKMPYDVSRPLRKLQGAESRKEMQIIFDELWENLHHQGDVGLASYLAVPQLISICIHKKSLDWNFIGLCVLIENCRVDDRNPELPKEYDEAYFGSLTQFEKYLLLNFKNIVDRTALRLTLALLATINGQPGLGKALEILDEGALEEFLKQF